MLAAVLVDVRNEESRFLHPLHDQFARAVPAIALEAVEAQIFRRDQPVGGLGDIGLAIEHVEHIGGLEPGALTELESAENMVQRDFTPAAAWVGTGMGVG